MIRIAVAAQAPAVRAGLRALLQPGRLFWPVPQAGSRSGSALSDDSEGRLAVVAEAASLSELAGYPPDYDVLVWVVESFSRQEFEPARALWEQAGLLLLTTEESDPLQILPEMLRRPPANRRAWGILPLEATADELQAAIGAIQQGLATAPPALLEQALARPFSEPEGEADAFGEGANEGANEGAIERLTGRETEVLQLLAQGLANKQIAAALGISEHTIKFHVSAIYARLGANSRTEAVRIGVRRGLIAL